MTQTLKTLAINGFLAFRMCIFHESSGKFDILIDYTEKVNKQEFFSHHVSELVPELFCFAESRDRVEIDLCARSNFTHSRSPPVVHETIVPGQECRITALKNIST